MQCVGGNAPRPLRLLPALLFYALATLSRLTLHSGSISRQRELVPTAAVLSARRHLAHGRRRRQVNRNTDLSLHSIDNECPQVGMRRPPLGGPPHYLLPRPGVRLSRAQLLGV
ncbi:hypothetical protein EVAR_79076_1 [Eumeta japonica]|uniref:Secreted protein n=1 Tax=Eumeta variegata TaxID=151549 RepID=A0A4C1ZNQ8_EUMVA|nr:hypothetical protein EVAR_79076_1 [Eumeta japonica]